MTDELYEVQEYLKQYRYAKQAIKTLQDELSMKEEQVNALCKAPQESPIQRATWDNNKERQVCSYIDFKVKVYMEMDIHISLCETIETNINKVETELHRNILHDRYIKDKPFQWIAAHNKISTMTAWRKHEKALEEYRKTNCIKFA